MARKTLFLALMIFLTSGYAASAFGAQTLTVLGRSPFCTPPLKSEADLRAMVRDRASDLKTGFTKAGYQDLYPVFMEQFPKATIESIKVPVGETFMWMLVKRKGSGTVRLARDLKWGGTGPFDAHAFDIDKDGQRYRFVVPGTCANLALKDVGPIPQPVAIATPVPPPVAPKPVPVAPPPAAAPTPVPAPVAPKPAPVAPPPPPPAPVVAPVVSPVRTPVAPVAPPPAPVAPKPAAAAPKAAPVAKVAGGPVVDVGFCNQPDPARYLFARVGYELPLTDRLYLLGLVGGFARVSGESSGSAFTAEAMLDYHWWNRLSFGLGAGYWSSNDGQLDLIANTGYLLFGDKESTNGTIFLEGRSEILNADENNFGYVRWGVGLRTRF
jgi:hypothetical protein